MLNPPAALEADPSPLVAAVSHALQQASSEGCLRIIQHAVIKGCIQLVMWVQDAGLGPTGCYGPACDDALMQGAALAAARQVLCDGGGEDGGWEVNLGQVGLGSENAWWVEGGEVVLEEGGSDLVVKVLGGAVLQEMVKQAGGRVRVVLVEAEGGQVVLDEELCAEVEGGDAAQKKQAVGAAAEGAGPAASSGRGVLSIR